MMSETKYAAEAAAVVNLIKHLTIVIYDSRVILTTNLLVL